MAEGDKIDIKWLAGFLDGEGCFAATRRKMLRSTTGYRWEPLANVSNTNGEMLLRIHQQYGGRFSPCNMRNPNYKPMYQVTWANAQAAPFIRLVLPHLEMKKPQALLVLALAESIVSEGNPGRRGHPPNVLEFRERIGQEVKRLNRRGVEVAVG